MLLPSGPAGPPDHVLGGSDADIDYDSPRTTANTLLVNLATGATRPDRRTSGPAATSRRTSSPTARS